MSTNSLEVTVAADACTYCGASAAACNSAWNAADENCCALCPGDHSERGAHDDDRTL